MLKCPLEYHEVCRLPSPLTAKKRSLSNSSSKVAHCAGRLIEELEESQCYRDPDSRLFVFSFLLISRRLRRAVDWVGF